MKYKVGDKVRVIYKKAHYGHTGIVLEVSAWATWVKCSCGEEILWENDDSLELTENAKEENKLTIKNTMKKLNNLFKKLTDPSVQSLSEAGILNGDLELTEEGRKELMTILFLANKEALVARAEEIIKEAKEDK